MAGAVTQEAPTGSWLKNGDIVLSLGVVGILMLMILPLPRVLVDLLLAFNLSLALIVLFVSMYTLRPMEFSAFPSVLLLVTLFRLALNIATTRLILLHGSEGIDAAGQVIAQSDAVPGGRETTGWRGGEYILDRHVLVFNERASAGAVRLIVALYDAQTGARVRLADGADAEELQAGLAVE